MLGLGLILALPGGWVPGRRRRTVSFFLFHVFALTRDLDFASQPGGLGPC